MSRCAVCSVETPAELLTLSGAGEICRSCAADPSKAIVAPREGEVPKSLPVDGLSALALGMALSPFCLSLTYQTNSFYVNFPPLLASPVIALLAVLCGIQALRHPEQRVPRLVIAGVVMFFAPVHLLRGIGAC